MSGGKEESKKRKRMRMTLPKKESDLEKVVEEVMELHPELAEEHHHHHHHHELDEYLHVIDTLIDILNSRLRDVEEKCKTLVNDVRTLYKLVRFLFEAVAAEDRETRLTALQEAVKVLQEAS